MKDRRGTALLAVVLASAATVAACGSSSKSTGSGGGSSSPAAPASASGGSSGSSGTGNSSAAGSPSAGTKASGQAITIGMINQENTPAGSFPEVREGAQAAAQYVNNSLGGVNGRPIKIIPCITDASPSSGANCARQLLDDKVPLVAGGEDFSTSGSIPPLEKAKVPYVGGEPILTPELTSPDSWQFYGGSAGAFPALDAYIATTLKAKTVGIIYTDNPAGTSAATLFGKAILTHLGVTKVKLVPAAADAADFTAPVQQVTSGVDAVEVLFAAQGCSRIMSAVASLGVTAKMFYPGSCADASVIKAGGAGANNAYFNSEPMLFSGNDPQVVTWRSFMKQYAPQTTLSAYSQNGSMTVMNIVALLKKISGPITSAAVVAQLAQTKDEPSFMSHPYTCSRKLVSILPAVCDADNRILQYKNGAFNDILGTWLTGAAAIGLK